MEDSLLKRRGSLCVCERLCICTVCVCVYVYVYLSSSVKKQYAETVNQTCSAWQNIYLSKVKPADMQCNVREKCIVNMQALA